MLKKYFYDNISNEKNPPVHYFRHFNHKNESRSVKKE